MTNVEESKKYAKNLINQINPDLIISIERCRINNDGYYLNSAGKKIH